LKTGRVFLLVFLGLLSISSVRAAALAQAAEAASGTAGAAALQAPPAAAVAAKSAASASESRLLTLDVVVTDKAGQPVAGLQPEDFTLVDNKHPLSVRSIQAASGTAAKPDPPVEAILLLDAINSTYATVTNERNWLATYFQQNGGHLALPTTLVVLTEKGFNVQNHPTRDGKALSAFLDENRTGLRVVGDMGGSAGNEEHEETSLKALDFLAQQAAKRPGRKLLLWMSPGWRLYSNRLWYGLGNKGGAKSLFNYIASLSTALRAARMTVYSIDPLGAAHGQWRYEAYLKGATTPGESDYADLLLPVLATQTGGQVLAGNNDLASLIGQCTQDANAYYVLTFAQPPAEHANEYHEVEVRVGKPGLTARTRTGYYAQP